MANIMVCNPQKFCISVWMTLVKSLPQIRGLTCFWFVDSGISYYVITKQPLKVFSAWQIFTVHIYRWKLSQQSGAKFPKLCSERTETESAIKCHTFTFNSCILLIGDTNLYFNISRTAISYLLSEYENKLICSYSILRAIEPLL